MTQPTQKSDHVNFIPTHNKFLANM